MTLAKTVWNTAIPQVVMFSSGSWWRKLQSKWNDYHYEQMRLLTFSAEKNLDGK